MEPQEPSTQSQEDIIIDENASATISFRVPKHVEATAILKAKDLNITLSRLCSLILDKELDPENASLIGRKQLQDAIRQANDWQIKYYKLDGEVAKNNLANVDRDRELDQYRIKNTNASQDNQRLDVAIKTLQKQLQDSEKEVRRLQGVLKNANAHIEEITIFVTPKTFS